MTNALVPMTEMVPVLISEARRWRFGLAVLFACIAVAALVAGMLWPKTFTSSTTILVQQSNIITPLMEGAAVTTGNRHRASIARDVLFSNAVMDKILDAGGWTAKGLTPLERAKAVDNIKDRTRITSSRENLIHITYADTSAQRSYKVAQRMARLFIDESLAAKMHESQDAFDFISSQVTAYHAKLVDAENKLKAYRDSHPDARVGSGTATDSRISALRTSLENAHMRLTELGSTARTLQAQLAGESEINVLHTRSGEIGVQLAQLQSQLQTLLLTYTDAYPDVVRIRHQIDDLKTALATADTQSQAAKQAGTPQALDNNVKYNPLYQDMRRKLAQTRQEIASTSARLSASKQLLDSELDRSKRISNSEATVAGLTRDYQVNRDVYQDLLKRRENARVSMDIDKNHRGLTFTIQDPAILPLRPTGLRFMHFGLAGLLLAIAVPAGLLVTAARFDPRVRSPRQLEPLGIPLLASVPTYVSARDRTRHSARSATAVTLIVLVIIAYAVVTWLKIEKLL